MWLASEMAAFAQVAELGSFTAAARALGVPKVAVSRAIASLERRVGARLLARTTRRVALTTAGMALRPHCQRLLVEVDAVRARSAPRDGAGLRLRVLVDAGYGRLLVNPLVPRFMEHYPTIELQVRIGATVPERAGEDWDVLVCNGAIAGRALVHTPLGRLPQWLWATPAYLRQHGRPRQPADLAAHVLLRAATDLDGPDLLRLAGSDAEQSVRLRTGLRVNDPALVHATVAAGLGIGVLPEFLCRQGQAQGKLERVLPGWAVQEPLAPAALHAPEAPAAVAIRHFLEFLLANMVPVLSAPG